MERIKIEPEDRDQLNELELEGLAPREPRRIAQFFSFTQPVLGERRREGTRRSRLE
jgi:hypothetical protein